MEKRKKYECAMSWVDRAVDRANVTGVSLSYFRETDRLYVKKED